MVSPENPKCATAVAFCYPPADAILLKQLGRDVRCTDLVFDHVFREIVLLMGHVGNYVLLMGHVRNYPYKQRCVCVQIDTLMLVLMACLPIIGVSYHVRALAQFAVVIFLEIFACPCRDGDQIEWVLFQFFFFGASPQIILNEWYVLFFVR